MVRARTRRRSAACWSQSLSIWRESRWRVRDVLGRERLRERLAPVLDGREGVGRHLLDGLVVVGRHAVVGDEEVVDGAVGALGAERDAGGDGRLPGRLAALALAQELGVEHLSAGADERVAGGELEAEPGHEGRGGAGVRVVAVDGAEPERDLGQLDGDGVEVDAEDVVVGEEHLDALALAGVAVRVEGLAELGLLAAEVGVGELGDGLVEEGGRAHGGLADGEVQDVVGRHARLVVADELLEGVLHEALREHLGRVVGRRLLAVAPGEAVDEGALLVLEPGAGVSSRTRSSVLPDVLYLPRSRSGTK